MENHRKRYILLHDRVGHLQERSMGILGLLGFGAMKSTPTPILQGELLEALPDKEQPDTSLKIALAGIDQNNLRLECRTEDVKRLANEDGNLLLAISSTGLRYQTFVDKKRLDFGRQISPGSQVFVKVSGFLEKLQGTVRYIGELPPIHGTMFGVELIVSMFYVILVERVYYFVARGSQAECQFTLVINLSFYRFGFRSYISLRSCALPLSL